MFCPEGDICAFFRPARTAFLIKELRFMKEPKDIWEAALGELQVQVSKPNYDTWLKDTKGISFESELFTVATPNTFAAEWLQNRLLSLIKNCLANIVGHVVDVKFLIQNQPLAAAAPASSYDGGISVRVRPSLKAHNLNPKYTFDTFVAGESNHLALSAAREVAENPGQVYNPLYIYSDTGLGKTHLLQAIGNALSARTKTVVYASAEQLTNEFVAAIKSDNMDGYNQKYCSADVLLVDDFQFFSGKKGTLQSFFYFFNELYDNNCQIVITCDSSPREIASLGEKLRSRLEWGLVADIKAPDYNTRLQIASNKAKKSGSPIPVEVLQYIATHFHDNIRELEGVVNRMITYSKLNNVTPDLNVAQNALSSLIEPSRQNGNGSTPHRIIDKTAGYFEMSPQALTGKARDRKTAEARQVAMYILRRYGNFRLNEIGELFGGRDHSTVLYSCEKIASEINVDKQLSKTIEDICRELKIHRNSNS
jgi:chromosomal replication initiator protein